jgi:hypothetical protein
MKEHHRQTTSARSHDRHHSGVRSILRSPRKRKRLAYVAAVLAVVGVAVGVGLADPDTAHHLPQRFHGRAAGETTAAKAPFTATEQRRVEAVLQRFVDHAVARRDPAAAYDLVTRSIRGDTTRAEWASGNVPVYPYPAARQRVRIAWIWASYRDDVDFDVVLRPRKGAQVGAMAAGVEMKATGTGSARRWLVDSFTPREFYSR